MKQIIHGAIAFALLLGSAIAADPAYILRDDGLYVLQPDAMSLVKVAFVDQRTGAPPPGPGPTPPPDNPPGETTAAKSERLARVVNNKSEAAALAGMYALLFDIVSSDKTGEKSAKIASEIVLIRGVPLAGFTGGVERWKAWSAAMDADMGTNPKAQFFGDVRDGLAKAAGTEGSKFEVLQDAAQNGWTDSIKALRAIDKERAFDWDTLFGIILRIIELLKSLGIL